MGRTDHQKLVIFSQIGIMLHRLQNECRSIYRAFGVQISRRASALKLTSYIDKRISKKMKAGVKKENARLVDTIKKQGNLR